VKYHVNDEGRVLVCKADVRSCNFGEEEGGIGHYPNPKDAEKAYERHMQSKIFANVSRHPEIRYEAPLESASYHEKVLRDCYDRNKEMSQIQLAKHYNYVSDTISELYKKGMTTEKTHARETKAGLAFNDERVKAHTEIINEFIEKYKEVPENGEALFAGGLGGAGKSTVLGQYAGIDQSKYVTLNPDDIKEIMAEKGLIPKVKGLTPMEASPLVHEEASHITAIIFEKIRQKKKNIIFDITMSSLGSVQNRILHLKKAGYTKVSGVFVDITPETSHERGEYRYRQGLQDYLKNKNGHGGRFLPGNITSGLKTDEDSQFKSKNAENFVNLAKLGGFTHMPRVFNNNVFGRDPQEISFKKFVKGE